MDAEGVTLTRHLEVRKLTDRVGSGRLCSGQPHLLKARASDPVVGACAESRHKQLPLPRACLPIRSRIRCKSDHSHERALREARNETQILDLLAITQGVFLNSLVSSRFPIREPPVTSCKSLVVLHCSPTHYPCGHGK